MHPPPPIRLPRCLLSDLRTIGEILTKEGKANKDFSITLKTPLNQHLRTVHVHFSLLAECNGILENMQITSDEILYLPRRTDLNGGEKITRYKLLTRLFFYEHSRLKSSFDRFVFGLQTLGLLTKDGRKGLSKSFHDAMKTDIMVRNVMVHGEFMWGPSDNKLDYLGALEKKGLKAVPTRKHGLSSEAFPLLFRRACNKRGEIMRQGTRHLGRYIQNIIKSSAETYYGKRSAVTSPKKKKPKNSPVQHSLQMRLEID